MTLYLFRSFTLWYRRQLIGSGKEIMFGHTVDPLLWRFLYRLWE